MTHDLTSQYFTEGTFDTAITEGRCKYERKNRPHSSQHEQLNPAFQSKQLPTIRKQERNITTKESERVFKLKNLKA